MIATILEVELTELLDGVDEAQSHLRKELIHVEFMLERAVEREAHVKADLELAERDTREWQSRRDMAIWGFEEIHGAVRNAEDDNDERTGGHNRGEH